MTADITNLSCRIDGTAVRHLEKYVTISPVFNLTIPPDNVLGLTARVYAPDVDEGFYLMLAPLRAGAHTVRFTAASPDLSYSLDIPYNLIVQPQPHHGP
jgi:hypothetical protein